MTSKIHNRLLQVCLDFCGCSTAFNSSNNFICAKTDIAQKISRLVIELATIARITSQIRNQTSNLSHSTVYGIQKTQQIVVGSMPDELLYQKKFARSSSLVNAIHMFARSQNHKIVLQNPIDGKAIVVINIKELHSHNSTYKLIKNRIQQHYNKLISHF